jgi:acyl carrier protein
MSLEEEYGKPLPDEGLEKVHTIGDAVDLLLNVLAPLRG